MNFNRGAPAAGLGKRDQTSMGDIFAPQAERARLSLGPNVMTPEYPGRNPQYQQGLPMPR